MCTSDGCIWRDRAMLVACGEQPETEQLSAHLAECRSCRRLYADMRRLESVRMPTARVPEAVHRRLLAAAWDGASARRRRRSRVPSWLRGLPRSVPRLAWAAVFLMVVGVGVWQYKSSQPAPVPFLAEEMDYGFAALEMDLNALESEIELSLLDIS